VDHDHSSPVIKSQGHRSRAKVNNAVGLTSIVDRGQFSSLREAKRVSSVRIVGKELGDWE